MTYFEKIKKWLKDEGFNPNLSYRENFPNTWEKAFLGKIFQVSVLESCHKEPIVFIIDEKEVDTKTFLRELKRSKDRSNGVWGEVFKSYLKELKEINGEDVNMEV